MQGVKIARGEPECEPDMTPDFGSVSLFPDNGVKELSYVGWPRQWQVRIRSRACMETGGTRNYGDRSRQAKLLQFRRRVWSSSPWYRRQACSCRGGEYIRSDLGTTMPGSMR